MTTGNERLKEKLMATSLPTNNPKPVRPEPADQRREEEEETGIDEGIGIHSVTPTIRPPKAAHTLRIWLTTFA